MQFHVPDLKHPPQLTPVWHSGITDLSWMSHASLVKHEAAISLHVSVILDLQSRHLRMGLVNNVGLKIIFLWFNENVKNTSYHHAERNRQKSHIYAVHTGQWWLMQYIYVFIYFYLTPFIILHLGFLNNFLS